MYGSRTIVSRRALRRLEIMGQGIDFRKLFSAIPAQATAIAIMTALSPIVGGFPDVVNRGTHWAVVLNEPQQERLTEWILTQLRKEPGPVRVETGSVALRVVTRQYWPWFAGAVAGGFLLAKMGRR